MKRRATIAAGLALAGWTGFAAAQKLVIPPVSYPALKQIGAGLNDFAPPGWVIQQSVTGDLNKDGVGDIAFVLHQNSKAYRIANSGAGEDVLDTNPRILAAAFAEAGGYRLALENHTLIPRRENPSLDDPLAEGGISMDRGALVVRVSFFANVGAWDAYNSTFRLRFDGEMFRLIGFDKNLANRASGETEDTSVNYLTGMATISKGTIDNDKPTSAKQRPVGKRALLTLDEIGNGLDFEPLK